MPGFKGAYFKGKEWRGRRGGIEGKEKGKGKWRSKGGGRQGLVYATPLLQHQAQFGLNPTMVGVSFDTTTETAEPIEAPFGVGPKNHVLAGGPEPPAKGQFGGISPPTVK